MSGKELKENNVFCITFSPTCFLNCKQANTCLFVSAGLTDKKQTIKKPTPFDADPLNKAEVKSLVTKGIYKYLDQKKAEKQKKRRQVTRRKCRATKHNPTTPEL